MQRVENGRAILAKIENALMGLQDQKVESDFWETKEAKQISSKAMQYFNKINQYIPKDIQKIDKRLFDVDQARRGRNTLHQEVDRVTDSINDEIIRVTKKIEMIEREMEEDIYGDSDAFNKQELKEEQKKLKELDKAFDKIMDNYDDWEKLMRKRSKLARTYNT